MKHYRIDPLKTYFGALEAECIAETDDAEAEEYISIYEATRRREHFQQELESIRADRIGLENLLDRLNEMKK